MATIARSVENRQAIHPTSLGQVADAAPPELQLQCAAVPRRDPHNVKAWIRRDDASFLGVWEKLYIPTNLFDDRSLVNDFCRRLKKNPFSDLPLRFRDSDQVVKLCVAGNGLDLRLAPPRLRHRRDMIVLACKSTAKELVDCVSYRKVYKELVSILKVMHDTIRSQHECGYMWCYIPAKRRDRDLGLLFQAVCHGLPYEKIPPM